MGSQIYVLLSVYRSMYYKLLDSCMSTYLSVFDPASARKSPDDSLFLTLLMRFRMRASRAAGSGRGIYTRFINRLHEPKHFSIILE